MKTGFLILYHLVPRDDEETAARQCNEVCIVNIYSVCTVKMLTSCCNF